VIYDAAGERSAEHHAGPLRDECLRRSEPQTAAAAGDEVNPAVQPKIDPAILPVWGRAASPMRQPALCALHHALFDLGITEDRRIRVSSLYVAKNEAGQAVDALAGKPLLVPRPHQPTVDVVSSPGIIGWSSREIQNIDSAPLPR
jgi:hypothetical protein